MKNNLGENNCFVNSIIHFFNYIPELLSYITNPKFESKLKISPLLTQLSLLMTQYKDIHDSDGCDNNIILDPIGLREEIAKFFKQEKIYQIGQQGDPIELLIFFLQSFHSISFPDYNKNLKENENKCDPRCLSHLLFHIGLKEVKDCQRCHNKVITPYHTNYFIYEIYIKEVFEYLLQEDNSSQFQQNFEKLFILSKKAMEYVEYPCDKCKNNISSKKLYCNSNGKYLIIQTSDLNHNTSMEQVCKSYFLIPKCVNSEDLFFIEKNGIQKTYSLFGIILYWNKHYLSVFYDKDLKQYVLYDDTTVLTYDSWDGLIPYLLKNQYCPIALFYGELDSEKIKKTPKSFKLSEKLYFELLCMCRKADQQRVKSNNEPSNKLKENEWICNFCSFVNIKTTYICKSCGKSNEKIYELFKKTKQVGLEIQGKNQREEKENGQKIDKQKEIENKFDDSKIISDTENWTCECGNVNPNSFNQCLKCKKKKIVPKDKELEKLNSLRDLYNQQNKNNREEPISKSSYIKEPLSQSTITNSSQIDTEKKIMSSKVKKSEFLSQSIMAGSSILSKEFEMNEDKLSNEIANINLLNSNISESQKDIQKPKIKQDEWYCDFCEMINKISIYICPNCRCINEDIQKQYHEKTISLIHNYY